MSPCFELGSYGISFYLVSLLLPGRLEAGIGLYLFTFIGSGERGRKCLQTSSPVTCPAMPSWRNRVVFPFGQ